MTHAVRILVILFCLLFFARGNESSIGSSRSRPLEDLEIIFPVRHVDWNGDYQEKLLIIKQSELVYTEKLEVVCLAFCQSLNGLNPVDINWSQNCLSTMLDYVRRVTEDDDLTTKSSTMVHSENKSNKAFTPPDTIVEILPDKKVIRNENEKKERLPGYISDNNILQYTNSPISINSTPSLHSNSILEDRVLSITSADGQSVKEVLIGRASDEQFHIFWSGIPSSGLSIGRYTTISKDVTFFLDGQHCYKHITMFPFAYFFRSYTYHLVPDLKLQCEEMQVNPIHVGNDVVLERNVIIMFGVHIGDGAIIKADSVVRQNVSSYSIVAGNPAQLIMRRYPQYILQTLQKVAWWNWSDEQITYCLSSLQQEDPLILLNCAIHLKKLSKTWREEYYNDK